MDGWMDGRCLLFSDLGVVRACVRETARER